MNGKGFNQHRPVARRDFLHYGGMGLGGIALASLLAEQGLLGSGAEPIRPVLDPARPYGARLPHFTPKAQRMLLIFCTGALSHVDSFDFKPELVKRNGQDCPDAFLKGKRFAFTSGVPKLLGTPRTFKQCGQGGSHACQAMGGG